MKAVDSMFLGLLQAMDPEKAHDLSIRTLARGLGPTLPPPDDPALGVEIWGKRFNNPIGLAAGLLVLFAAARLHPDGHTLRWFAVPVTATYLEQLRFIHAAATKDTATLVGAAALPDARLGRLRDSDVLLIFIESYGATTLDDPGHAAALADARNNLAGRIRANGFQVVSARVRSPTFGGGANSLVTEVLGEAAIISSDFGGNPPYEKMYDIGRIVYKHWLAQSNVLFIIGGKANNTDIYNTFRGMADALRDQLQAMGIELEDGAGGTRWRRQS